jgi:hypothetical protein
VTFCSYSWAGRERQMGVAVDQAGEERAAGGVYPDVGGSRRFKGLDPAVVEHGDAARVES